MPKDNDGIAENYEFDHSKLVFEVVESHRVEDLDYLNRILEFYKDRSFKVVLDDVGSGYSNLKTLSKT
ncbi:MAG: EAL domain-containing protein [Hydrogenothermaceae bacterium]|nr:EAL domain-containing protein [Hydrogenothermaceae bacterium]